MSAVRTAIDCLERPVDAALFLAREFGAGRRLVVESAAYPDHAHHIAVEFVHPVVAGAISLPTVAVGADASRRPRGDEVFLEVSAEPATEHDLLIPAGAGDAPTMIAYHVLWELVQVCLEHPGIVGVAPAEGGDSTGFLYPFLDASEFDEPGLRDALQRSAAAKRAESEELQARSVAANRDAIVAAAAAVTSSVAGGGRVFTMGNGGSSTDAARIVRLLTARGVDATSLAADYAVLSALANDLGAGHVFSRQVDALVRAGDVLIGCSTSGASANLLAAFERAAALGATGIGISGYGGGGFPHQPGVDHCLAVESESVHRIQEAQAAIIAALIDRVAVGRAPA